MTTPLEKWVAEQAKLMEPDKIYWCDGSEEEARRLIEVGLKEEKIEGQPVFYPVTSRAWPNSYLHRSHPTDVARTEHLTFVCHPTREMAGPNNHWMDPAEAKVKMTGLSKGCMRGRTMYVMPYMMGHQESPYAKACVQLTDISYVAVSIRIMTRMDRKVVEKIGTRDDFLKGIHSVGDFHPERRFIMHFPEENLVWSIGSGYGGNALLGKKCFSLRLASCAGRREGWLAEHMVIMGVQDPGGNVTYVAAALPSACGKTNLAMLEPTLPGYKIWTLGDDIAWLNIGPDGRLWAINPEAGFFGVAPGTSMKTNPNMMRALKKGEFYPTLFTNTAFDPVSGEPWWEGLDGAAPKTLLDWQGKAWSPSAGTKAAHPNSRFTVSANHCPNLSTEFDNPGGVPISAIIFGGRRSRLIPLVNESLSWQHGVFLGAGMGSETTAAAAHQTGQLRRDPMAMLPFCGYNMGDYFAHWLDVGRKIKKPPKIFSVNWFRTDDQGKIIWPGFGENVRVLKWIIDRVNHRANAEKTPIGLVPRRADLSLEGLVLSASEFDQLFAIKEDEWAPEIDDIRNHFEKFGSSMPAEIWDEFNALSSGLGYGARSSA